MIPVIATSGDVAKVLLELGLVVLGLAVLARVADRLTLSPIPLYILAGLALGQGGVVQLDLSEEFIEVGAAIGVVLLLLALGVEYTAEELTETLTRGWTVGIIDAFLGFVPGLLAGLALGWGGRAALLLGGVTWVSSSGVAAKLLRDLGRLGNRETPAVLGILVFEDLAMALYLPVAVVVVAGDEFSAALVSVLVTVAVVGVVLTIALRYGKHVTRLLASPSDEVLLLSVLGVTLVVAGLAEELRVSAAVGAFLVGIALSGSVSSRVAILIGPLRDLFAATFFLFFALQVDPGQLPAVLGVALTLALVTGATKAATGWIAAARIGAGRAGRARAGTVLIARGEFAIVIAGLGVAGGITDELGAVAAAYVLVLAVAGPVITRFADAMVRRPRPIPGPVAPPESNW